MRELKTDSRSHIDGRESNVQRLLSRFLLNGQAEIVLPGGKTLFITGAKTDRSTAHAKIKYWRAIYSFLSGGVLGLGESFIKGHWDSNDLSAFLKYGISNRGSLKGFLRGVLVVKALNRIRHFFRRNSPRGSRKNIAYHYDLGNKFYELWLDRTMTYSSAIFSSARDSLEQAQENKYSKLSELAGIGDSSRVLEIGCGWGGFINHAVSRYGCYITGVTISAEQFSFVQKMIRRQKFQGSARVDFQDYRSLNGVYDKIISIEMVEAVGERYWPEFFRKLKKLLRPNGDIGLQLITIDRELFPHYKRSPDFIQKYIFPGGMLMTKELLSELSVSTGLRLVEIKSYGCDYAKTLRIWRERFNSAWPEMEKIGFEMSFKRMWNFYLCYCEAGFDEGFIDVSQVHLIHAI